MDKCPTCKSDVEVTRTDYTTQGGVLTFSCGDQGVVNPNRGTAEHFEKDGKPMIRVDNRMYLPYENPEVAKRRAELEAKDAEIAELEKRLAELEANKKKPHAPDNNS